MTQQADVTAALSRLTTAATTLDRLQGPIDAGRPWPVGPVAGEGPESEWGPPEVLAHVAEMLGYWLDQMELVIAGGGQPVPMGRQPGDPTRIGSIELGRSLPTADLLDQIHQAVARYSARLPQLTTDDWGRVGVHPRLGEMTVAEMLPRFVLGHMEEHAAQIEAVLGVAGSEV